MKNTELGYVEIKGAKNPFSQHEKEKDRYYRFLDRSKYEISDINNSSNGFIARYSGTLGTAWFKARTSKAATEEERTNEEKSAKEYVDEIRKKKTDIINEYGLQIEKTIGNQVFFVKYADEEKTKYIFTFIVHPKERTHLKKHTGLDIDAFVMNQK